MFLSEIATEAIIQRRKYKYKIDSIDIVNITNEEQTKDLVLLNRIKSSIISQKKIEDWNMSFFLQKVEKWKVQIENFQKVHSINQKTKEIVELKKNWEDALKLADELRISQNNYFLKYNSFIDYLISKNKTFIIKNKRMVFIDDKDLLEFNNYKNSYNNAVILYTEIITQFKLETDRLNYLNKNTVNIKEVDTLVKMVK